MNLYFELADVVIGLHAPDAKYLAAYDVPEGASLVTTRYGSMTRGSDRIWCEEGDHVWYIKHRSGLPHNTLVDKKEFFWVKLRSVKV